MSNIGILGAGSWGTALARTLTVGGHSVTLWSALEKELLTLREGKTHPNLPGMVFPEEVRLTADLGEAICGADVVVFAVASPFTRQTARAAAPYLKAGQIVVDVAKGLEASTHMTLTEVIADELNIPGIPLVALCGPTHAEELALDMPTAIVAATPDEDAARFVQQMFSNGILRVYTNPDIKGVEVCGALKNIVAIAAGLSDGLGYGDNAKAAIITRGMAEIMRLGSKMGGSKETFTSLAGIGDLIVTCTSRHSRNNRAGYLMGQGVPPADAIRQVGMVVEGINALPAAMELAEKHNVELPLCSTVHSIVTGEITAANALKLLMSRELKTEYE